MSAVLPYCMSVVLPYFMSVVLPYLMSAVLPYFYVCSFAVLYVCSFTVLYVYSFTVLYVYSFKRLIILKCSKYSLCLLCFTMDDSWRNDTQCYHRSELVQGDLTGDVMGKGRTGRQPEKHSFCVGARLSCHFCSVWHYIVLN